MREIGRMRFAEALQAVVSQQLLPEKDEKGQVAAVEVLLATPAVRETLRDQSRFAELRKHMADGGQVMFLAEAAGGNPMMMGPASYPYDDLVKDFGVDVQAKYAGYIERQAQEIERQRRNEETALPENLDYSEVRGLSTEARQRLSEVRPATLGQAARVPGITPAAVSLLLIHLKKRSRAA